MSSNRRGRINEEMLHQIAEVIKNVKDPRISKGLVSVTHAEVAPDMSTAKVYVSILGDDASMKELLKGLKSAAGYIRHELSKTMQIRRVPELSFHADKSMEEGAHIMNLLSKIEVKDEESD